MSPWEILAIEPTKDKTLIKQAYDTQLRAINEKGDAAKDVEQLNEAYSDILSEIDIDEASLEDTSSNDGHYFPPIQHMLNQFEQLLEQGLSAQWDNLLNNKALNDHDYKTTLSFNFFEMLIDYNKANNQLAINQPYRQQLLEHFNWHEQQVELCQCFDEAAVNDVLTALEPIEPDIDDQPTPEIIEQDTEQEPLKNPVDDLDLTASIKDLLMLFLRMVFIVIVTYFIFIKD